MLTRIVIPNIGYFKVNFGIGTTHIISSWMGMTPNRSLEGQDCLAYLITQTSLRCILNTTLFLSRTHLHTHNQTHYLSLFLFQNRRTVSQSHSSKTHTYTHTHTHTLSLTLCFQYGTHTHILSLFLSLSHSLPLYHYPFLFFTLTYSYFLFSLSFSCVRFYDRKCMQTFYNHNSLTRILYESKIWKFQ